MEGAKRWLRMVINILIPLAGIFLTCFFLPRLLGFFLPFVIGWLLAMIANPLVKYLERHLKLVRRHSSMLIIISVLALVIGLSYLAISCLYRELRGFVSDAPAIYESVVGEVNSALAGGRRLLEFLPAGLKKPILEFSANLGGVLGSLFSQAAVPTVEIAGNVARSLPSILVNTVVLILSSYLFLADHDRITRWLGSCMPEWAKRYLDYMKRDVKGLIGGYFLAQFRIMFVVAIILFLGFLVLQVRYGFLLAVLIAILDFLPVFGTGTVLFPWAVVKLFGGEYPYAAALVLIYITTQVVRQMIQPKIVGDSMGLPPLLTLFLLYLGFKVRGIAGMILAVPVGLIFINFYKYGAFDSLIENTRLLVHEINAFRNNRGPEGKK